MRQARGGSGEQLRANEFEEVVAISSHGRADGGKMAPLCRFFQEGWCRHGGGCRHTHIAKPTECSPSPRPRRDKDAWTQWADAFLQVSQPRIFHPSHSLSSGFHTPVAYIHNIYVWALPFYSQTLIPFPGRDGLVPDGCDLDAQVLPLEPKGVSVVSGGRRWGCAVHTVCGEEKEVHGVGGPEVGYGGGGDLSPQSLGSGSPYVGRKAGSERPLLAGSRCAGDLHVPRSELQVPFDICRETKEYTGAGGNEEGYLCCAGDVAGRSSKKRRSSAPKSVTADAMSRRVTVSHSLHLRSAYSNRFPVGVGKEFMGEPAYTSFHGRAGITVDYVFVSRDIQVLGVWEMLPCDELEIPHSTLGVGGKPFSGLPSREWGSDHMALACHLQLGSGGNGLHQFPP